MVATFVLICTCLPTLLLNTDGVAYTYVNMNHVIGYYYNHSFDYQHDGHHYDVSDDAFDGDYYVFCADPEHVYDDQAHMDFGANNALCGHANSFEFGYPATEEYKFRLENGARMELTPSECKEKVEAEIPNWTVSRTVCVQHWHSHAHAFVISISPLV